MARVTADEVRAIIDVSADVTDLTPFITVAHLTVSDVLGASVALSEAQLKEIERWLAAHFVAIRDKRVASETAGSVGESYQYKLGLGLESTMFGQQAVALDTSGKLSALVKHGGKRPAQVKALS